MAEESAGFTPRPGASRNSSGLFFSAKRNGLPLITMKKNSSRMHEGARHAFLQSEQETCG
jgi:hypothetical protein